MVRSIMAVVAALAVCWTVAAQAATGCAVATPGTTERVIIGDTGRAMLIHLPTGLTGRAPLVFVLHGSTGSGKDILANSRLVQTADAHGFVVAAADGGIAAAPGFVWNIPGVPTVTGKIPGPNDPDDVAYLLKAIDWLVKQGCVDRARVYATGLSGGGRMTSWLGCVAADRFAAIAPVVGLRAGNPLASDPRRPDPATCRPSRPVPVIAFAGDADTTNPIGGGGAPYWQYTMQAAEARWAKLNRCTGAPARRSISPRLYEERYSRCAAGADVVGRITVGGGHSWVVDNEALWAFLSRYRR